MTDPPRPDFLELADYSGVLRRRGWIALALAGLGGLVSLSYLAVAPASYQATADVYVTPNSANQNVVLGSKGTSTAVNMDNEAQIVESNTVAVLAARTLHSRVPPQALLGQVSVSVPANTAVLAISCAARSPGGAAACAQAFARGYLAARHTTAVNKLAFELTQEQDKAAGLESRSVTLHDQIGRLAPGSADRAQAVLELRTVSAKLQTLRTSISAINASVNTNPGYIITSALPPSAAASPKPLLYLPSGLLAGLLAGLVVALAVDRRDDRVHTVREVERLDGLPVLYSVDARRLSPPGAVAPARSAAGRGYAELAQAVAAGLGAAVLVEKGRVLLVAAGSPGPAAGVVAANLAAALARVRGDVVLVCADPRDTMTPALLGVGEARGLAEVLSGTATVAEVTRQAADVSRLEVITPGRDPAAAPGQVRHDVTGRLVDGLRRDGRYVIICGLAAGNGADTLGLAEFADAALVVVELERTRRPELAACLRRLDRVRTLVLGAALLPEITGDRGSRRAGSGRGGASRGSRLGFGRGRSGRVPPGLRPNPPSRSGRSSRWEPASAQPPWDTDDSPWDAAAPDHQEPPRDASGPVSQDLSWGAPAEPLRDTGHSAGRESPHAPSGRSRPEPSWGAAAEPPWGSNDPGGREPPHGPPGRSRPKPSRDSAARGGPAPNDAGPAGAGSAGAGLAGPGEPPWAAGEPGRPEPAWGPGPAKPPRAEPRPARPEPSQGAGKPPPPQPPSGSGQPFRVQPPGGSANPGRPEAPRNGASPSRPGSSGAGDSRPGPPWGGTAPSWSEPAWPVGESAWPEPMWGGLGPSRSEPPAGTADPAKSEAPRPDGPPSRPGAPSWGPTETWPLPAVPRDPGAPWARPSDPQDRATGTG